MIRKKIAFVGWVAAQRRKLPRAVPSEWIEHVRPGAFEVDPWTDFAGAVLGDDALLSIEPRPLARRAREQHFPLFLTPHRVNGAVLPNWSRVGVRRVIPVSDLQAELEQYVPSLLRPVLSLDEWFDPGGFEVGEQGRRAVELLQDLARPSAGAWSKALGCTRHALRRLCQREFGLPTEEVVWLWVAHCVLEVRRQGATLAEAAELFGYSNAGSLHRAFSRRGIPVPSRGSVAQRAAG